MSDEYEYSYDWDIRYCYEIGKQMISMRYVKGIKENML
jgi:hypothetical protein